MNKLDSNTLIKKYSNRLFAGIVIGLIIIGVMLQFVDSFFPSNNFYKIIKNYKDNFIGLFGTLFFGFAFIYLIKDIIKYYSSKNWLKTEAVILSSELIEKPGSESNMYEPLITYKYILKEKEYFSDKVYPISNFSTSIKYFIKKIVDKYHQDQVVQIYYNPQNPSESCLERKGLFHTLIFFLLAFFLVSVFILMLFGITNMH